MVMLQFEDAQVNDTPNSALLQVVFQEGSGETLVKKLAPNYRWCGGDTYMRCNWRTVYKSTYCH